MSESFNPRLRPSVDHSLISPDGHISKRAKDAAIKRTALELFGPNGLQLPDKKQPTLLEATLRRIAELRELANRGMKPRAYRKLADKLEKSLLEEN